MALFEFEIQNISVLAAMMLYPSSPEAATRFIKFVNASPTPFHAVHNAALRLEKAGFQKVVIPLLVA